MVAATPGFPLRTRLTVASLTPAWAAMSASRVVTALDCTGRDPPCPPIGRRVRAVVRPAVGCCVIAFPRVVVGVRSRRPVRNGMIPPSPPYGKSLQSLAQASDVPPIRVNSGV
ncbi:hypothetical protein GCM10014715_51210 [Streptomyces spiralis]|uniref:Uncharacterized protein n=1 Tax=Streptomyces spiralis TaxID=66376 RepID=A0A919A6D2_9ACTN|nr:hypothetical protein GCM10014715_51210 [Streptomyces spiralis]